LSHLNPLSLRIDAAKHILDNRRKINITKEPTDKDRNSPLNFDEYNKACEILNNAGFITKLKEFTPERLANHAMNVVAKKRDQGAQGAQGDQSAQGGKKRSRKYRKNRKTRSRKNRKTRSRK
jgi:hypothetical protein